MNWLVAALFIGIVWPGILSRQVAFTTGLPNDSCQYHESNWTLICTNFTSTALTSVSIETVSVKSLLLYRADSPLVNLSGFSNLRKLVIQNTNVRNVTNLDASPLLKEINITNNPLLEWINLTNLANIEHLNLSHNGLQDIDGGILVDLPQLASVDLTGNKWMCKKDYSWAVGLDKTGKLANWRDLNCTEGEDEWNKHPYRIVHYQRAYQIVQQQCRDLVHPECNCTFYDLKPMDTELRYTVNVSCSSLQLTELPPQLPDRTLRLDLSNNSISSLNTVAKYKHLQQLVLDNNNITSASELKETPFIKQFTLLSLKSNPIPPENIPFKELELKNSTDVAINSSGLRLIRLENNSWVCNDFLANFVQNWLWRNHQLLLQDFTRASTQPPLKIYCSDEHGKAVNVFFLFPPAPKEWDVVHLLHWVIGLEASLIVFVLTKLAFDAYIFKTHNRLPWLATKLLK